MKIISIQFIKTNDCFLGRMTIDDEVYASQWNRVTYTNGEESLARKLIMQTLKDTAATVFTIGHMPNSEHGKEEFLNWHERASVVQLPLACPEFDSIVSRLEIIDSTHAAASNSPSSVL